MKYNAYAFKLFKLSFSLSKKFYLFSALRAITNALKSLVGVYGLSLLISALTGGDFIIALYYAGGILGAEVLLRLAEIVFQTQIELVRTDMINKLKIHIADKLMHVEFRYLEDPKYLTSADKAKFAVDNFQALHNFLDNMIDLINQFFIICSLGTIIVMFKPIVLLAVAGSLIIHFIVSKFASQKQIAFYEELGPVNRKFGYFARVAEDVKYQKDFRIYPLGELTYKKYDQFLDQTCQYMVDFYKIIAKFQIYYIIITLLQILAIYLIVGISSITEALGVATYILLTASTLRATNAIDNFASRIIQIRRNVQMLKPVFEVLDMEDSITFSEDGFFCEPLQSIRFDHVSFSYPGSDKIILDDVSFTINKGDKISIVGLNGAGKTTIVKLISRFYKTTGGSIYWNDININEYEFHSYIKQVSAVFQDFKLFALSISENVDLEEQDKASIKKCLYQVGLEDKIESLPNNIDSFLSKEYNKEGIDLSGGEKQKIAIARAMYQNASLTILDEPTSALDPISEAEIYEHFNELTKGKTTIYISHRMSSSVFCDRIIVLDNGKIIQMDSHKNLMKQQQGIYYDLFQAQSKYYQK